MSEDLSALQSIRALSERALTPDEFDAWVDAPMSTQEREELLSLIEWFCRRYPTALERLDASRRMTQDALRLREAPRRPAPDEAYGPTAPPPDDPP